MATSQEITAIAQRVRVASPENSFVTDLEESEKKIESEKGYDIRVEKIKESNIKELMEFSKYSGNAQRIGEREYLIKINPFDYELRQRFTIAHELGHVVLDHFEDNIPIFDPAENIIGRPQQTISSSTDIREVQANQFAAELLMPEDLMREYFDHMGDISMTDVENATEKFQVSKAAMMVRLDSLNYKF